MDYYWLYRKLLKGRLWYFLIFFHHSVFFQSHYLTKWCWVLNTLLPILWFYELLTQQTQRRFDNVVTTSESWLYWRCQFVGNESFASISWQRCCSLKKWRWSNVVPTLWQRYKVVTLQNALQRLSNVTWTLVQLIFWYFLESYLYGDNKHLNIKTLLKVEP